MSTVRVELPVHLRTLARVEAELRVEVAGEPTVQSVLDALESRYPMLRGTIREQSTQRRRAYIRYFAAGEDVSFEPANAPLPTAVASGADVLRVVGAIAGG